MARYVCISFRNKQQLDQNKCRIKDLIPAKSIKEVLLLKIIKKIYQKLNIIMSLF